MNTTYENQTAAFAHRTRPRTTHNHDLGDRLASQAAYLAHRIALLWADPVSDGFARERRHDEQLLRRN